MYRTETKCVTKKVHGRHLRRSGNERSGEIFYHVFETGVRHLLADVLIHIISGTDERYRNAISEHTRCNRLCVDQLTYFK